MTGLPGTPAEPPEAVRGMRAEPHPYGKPGPGARPTLAQRVAALEERLAHPQVIVPAAREMTGEEAEQFARDWAGGGFNGRIEALPSRPPLTPETARELLRECVTVVKPGETLVIRTDPDWTVQQVHELQMHANAAREDGRISFPVVVVPGEELAVVRPDADGKAFRAELDRHLPAALNRAAQLRASGARIDI